MFEMEKSQSQWFQTLPTTNTNGSSNRNPKNLSDPANKEQVGVQALTRFWNSQIVSIKSSFKSSKITRNNINSNCINNNNISSNNNNNNNSNTVDSNLLAREKFHTLDSFLRTRPNSIEATDLPILRNLDTSAQATVPESKHRNTTENFNKYKTADYVKSCTKPTDSQRTTFPLVGSNANGDQIHWIKRDEIINLAQSKSNGNSRCHSVTSSSSLSCTTSRKSSVCSEMEEAVHVVPQDPDTNSLSSISVSSLSRKTGRKLSFKTHPTQPRKMIPFNSGGGVSGAESKVAALTQRFNQMINEDSKILKEVKRKGVYVYKTQNHIYKIRDTENKRASSAARPKLSNRTSDDLNVQQAIEIFEPKSEKPKVPDKSERVLTYSKELTLRKSLRGSSSNINKIVPNLNSDNSHRNSKVEEIIKAIENNPLNEKVEDVVRPSTPVVVSETNIILKIIEDSDVSQAESQTDEIEAPNVADPKPNTDVVPVVPIAAAVVDDAVDEPVQVVKLKSKSYGSRIYEKIRLKFGSNKLKAASLSPEAKIVDALCTVNQKIEHLSKSVNDLNLNSSNHSHTGNSILEPNDSFLFRSASRNSFGSLYDVNHVEKVVEAVNTSLINRAHSMDETLFPKAKLFMQQMLDGSSDIDDDSVVATSPMCEEVSSIFKNTDNLISKLMLDYSNNNLCSNTNNQSDINDDYEYISRPKDIASISANDGKHVIEEPITIENIYETPKKKMPNPDNDIYHSISEMKSSIEAMKKFSDTYSENSYESYDNYESVEDTPKSIENAYEIQNPPEVPPPRKSISDVDNEPIIPITPPEIPLPKRKNDSTSTLATTSTSSSPNYEKIKYTKIPPRPPKSREPEHAVKVVPIQHIEVGGNDDIETRSIISNCYESINSMSRNEFMRMHILNHSDSMSTLSSEHKTNSLYGTTINSVTPPSEGCSENSDEWIDVSDGEDRNKKERFIVTRQRVKCSRSQEWNPKISEPKIMSECEDDMYEVAISSPSILYLTDPNGGTVANNGQDYEPLYQNTATSYSNTSNNDKCDNIKYRAGGNDKGLSTCRIVEFTDKIDDDVQPIECQLISCFMDDSDHHYESLYSMGYAIDKKSTVANATANGDVKNQHKTGDDEEFEQINRNSFDDSTNSTIIPTAYQTDDDDRRTIGTPNDDDFDSFESDGETDDELNKKNETNNHVDIINVKLPDPPPSQAYALLQKLKNFGSLSEISKSISSRIGKKTRRSTSSPSTTKVPTSPLAEHMDIYQNAPYEKRTVPKKTQQSTKASRKSASAIKSSVSHDPYENTSFHSPRVPSQLDISAIENSLNVVRPSPVENHVHVEPASIDKSHNLSRKKSKSSTSFKSKLKKNWVIAENSSGPVNSANPNNSGGGVSSPPSNYHPFSGTRSTFYVSDSVDPDSGIYSGSADQISTPQSTDESTVSLVNTSSQSDANNSSSNQSIDCTTPKVVAPPRRKYKVPRESPDLSRRQTVIGGPRPNDPPPPPPVGQVTNKQKRLGSTSWYAECGVFKQDALKDENNGLLKDGRKEKNSTTSWYADAGLYQTSADSVASSSGSSGVSTGGEGGPSDDNSHSMFSNEPLYQIYKLESITQDIIEQEQFDGGYEEVGHCKSTEQLNNQKEDGIKKYQRPSALQLIEPKLGPSRTLWSQVPEVINSGILQTLTKKERILQEVKFEILTSEASYLKSLTLLRSHFMNHPAFRDTAILSSVNRKCLFSQIGPVLECSDRLLRDLESCWQDNIVLIGLPKSILKNAEKHLQVYVKYCENQGRLDRLLKKLKAQKGVFSQTLEILENNAICCGLSLYSFLMLPMQRITRFPILIEAVQTKLKIDDGEFDDWVLAYNTFQKITTQCNEAAERSAQAYELEQISRDIEFPLSITPIPIVPVGTGIRQRVLVRRGELTMWKNNDDGKITFGKKLTKLQKETTKIYAFLFTDLLVLAKRKSDEKCLVIDYCQRSMLTFSSGDLLPHHLTKDHMLTGKYWMLMTLLENHDKKTVEMIVSCSSETERLRWIQTTEPPESENPDEKLYEQWDCPQVIAIRPYEKTQPDDIALEQHDVVNVLRKMNDGWLFGERLKDGVQGWFKREYTNEIVSPHVRARNLKQRHKLLVFSANYLESQKKL